MIYLLYRCRYDHLRYGYTLKGRNVDCLHRQYMAFILHRRGYDNRPVGALFDGGISDAPCHKAHIDTSHLNGLMVIVGESKYDIYAIYCFGEVSAKV